MLLFQNLSKSISLSIGNFLTAMYMQDYVKYSLKSLISSPTATAEANRIQESRVDLDHGGLGQP